MAYCMRQLTLLGVLLGLWYLLQFPLVKNDDEFCLRNQLHAIFAADNLQNGTIRLYGRKHYWNLELYHYDDEKDHSSPSWWLAPLVKLFSSKPDLPSTFLESGDLRLVARIDDHFGDERLIKSAFHGLNFTLQDTRSVHRAMVSLSDSKNLEYTFLFETLAGSNTSEDANERAHFWFWDTASGQFMNRFNVVEESAAEAIQPKSFLISTAFRVYLNGTQHLFFLVNNLFYFAKDLQLDDFTMSGPSANHIQPEYDQQRRFHRGHIPEPISAAFVVQASAERIWIVLIQCSHYCQVHWEMPEGYFDFGQCENASSWKLLDPFFSTSGNVFQGMEPFHNFVVLTNQSAAVLPVANTSSVWHTFSITRFGKEFGSFFGNPKADDHRDEFCAQLKTSEQCDANFPKDIWNAINGPVSQMNENALEVRPGKFKSSFSSLLDMAAQYKL